MSATPGSRPRACTRNWFTSWAAPCSPKEVVARTEPALGVNVQTAFAEPFTNRLLVVPCTAWPEKPSFASGVSYWGKFGE